MLMLKEKEKAYLHFQIVLQFFLPNKRKKIIPQLYSSNFKLNYFLHFEPFWIMKKKLSVCILAIFFFLEVCFCFFQWILCTVHGIHKLFFFTKTLIKNGFHGTIHTFKNYFTTVFSIFNKINDIQIQPSFED